MNMKTVKVIYGNEPILEVKKDMSAGEMVDFGLHRDRQPDSGWSELRWTRINELVKEVELTPELCKILIEDICYCYDNKHIFNKLKEYELIIS